MLFAALSCYQGKTMQEGYDNLLKLNVEGIQLTPGNIPTKDFKLDIPYRLHHTFSFNSNIGRIYDNNYITNINSPDHSIHPPKRCQYTGKFEDWLNRVHSNTILEIMYPIYYLSNDKEINMLLDKHQPVAVDISHLFICLSQKSISEETLNRIMNYDNIKEIHFSHNNGKFDSHQPMNDKTPFLSWGKERNNVPWIYESLLHKASYDEAMFQLDILRK